MDVLTDTVVPLEDRDMLVFGAGWDTRRSEVHEMMARAGIGPRGAPDLDLQVGELAQEQGDLALQHRGRPLLFFQLRTLCILMLIFILSFQNKTGRVYL